MSLRLFVSVDLPDRLVQPVRQLQTELVDVCSDDGADANGADANGAPDSIRLTDPTQAHITLTFLGDVKTEQLPALESALTTALEEAAIEPFPVTLGGLGAFPSLEHIRVLWLGVLEGGETLRRLQEALETRLTAIGFEPADHEFIPHVTVGRVTHAGRTDLLREAVREHDSAVGRLTVSEIRLTESTLTESGPTYETRKRFSLPLGESSPA